MERYRTLEAFGARTVPPEEHEMAKQLPGACRSLFVDAKTRDLRLVDTKAQFRIVTEEQTNDFAEQMKQMKKDYLDGQSLTSSVVDLEQRVGATG